jgi:Protein of unknown function (DUF3039)
MRARTTALRARPALWGVCAPALAVRLGLMSLAPEVAVAPPKPDLDGDHERMAHIVLEGVTVEDGEYLSAGPTVVEGIVNGTPVRALCGKVWVPGRDPKKYPMCPTCKEIAEQMGWAVPAS